MIELKSPGEVDAVAAAGAVVGSVLGCPFPPAVYIGHPGWKAAGGRGSYSLATGVVIALFCFLGLFGLLGALLPMPAIVPILLYAQIRGDVLYNPNLGYALAFGMIVITASSNLLYIWLRSRAER